ncbi:MAG: tryptophan-rich sensory protein [Gammaproteobacteria bacterium]|nr:tryptophan-rich sensory protein [Gammaproteobacteria bacterium]NNL46283.1 tryptophan-rich sensory protein [Woeseiaceae bacterium]
MQRPLSDWGGNIAAFILVVVLNALANALPINGQTMPEISAKYPSLFTPAGFTFSIWGVIYLALLLFVVYQALPAQRNNETIAGISRLFQVNCVANASWIVVWHYDLLTVSLLIMLVLLITLILIYRALLGVVEQASIGQHLFLHLPFSLYTGWITVATIANISIVQTGFGWDYIGLTAVNWTLLKLALAGAIGAAVVLRFGDAVFILVVAWAAYGISVMQSATPAVSGGALTLSLLALLLAMNEAVMRLRRLA